jgi:hypothetical protein
MEKVFWLDLQSIDCATIPPWRSGPFATRAEAERALREALGTGKFASGLILAELAPADGEEV